MRRVLKLPRSAEPEDIAWKLHDVNLLSRIMSRRLKLRIKENASERKLLMQKKDRLDILLALRMNYSKCKYKVDKKQYMSPSQYNKI